MPNHENPSPSHAKPGRRHRPGADELLVRSKEKNSKRRSSALPKPRPRGRTSFVCKSCFPDCIPARAKITARFDEAEPIPGPTSEALGRRGAEARRGDRRLAVRAPRGRACITTRRWCSMPTAARRACIARCTFPTIRCTTKNSISRRAIWVSRRSTRAFGRVGPLRLLGSVVSRSGAADGACTAPDFVLSHRHRLAAR